MGILTVVCYEQAGLFEYFSASGSQAGCSFVKDLYCISFLCQSPFPVALPCQTMTPGFLQVAWRRACHEPWGLTASHWTTSVAPTLSAFKSPPCAFEAHVFLFSLPPFNSFFFYFALISLPSSILSCLPPPACPPPPCLPLSTPPFLFASLLPSSLCPTVQVRRGSVRRFLCKPQVQTTPCEGISATTVSDALQKQEAHVCIYTWSYCTHLKYMVVFGSKLCTAEPSVCRKKKKLVGKMLKTLSVEITCNRNYITVPSRVNKKSSKCIFKYSE